MSSSPYALPRAFAHAKYLSALGRDVVPIRRSRTGEAWERGADSLSVRCYLRSQCYLLSCALDANTSWNMDPEEPQHEENACEPHASGARNNQDRDACSHAATSCFPTRSGQMLE